MRLCFLNQGGLRFIAEVPCEGAPWGRGGGSRPRILSPDIRDLGQSQSVPWKEGTKEPDLGLARQESLSSDLEVIPDINFAFLERFWGSKSLRRLEVREGHLGLQTTEPSSHSLRLFYGLYKLEVQEWIFCLQAQLDPGA